MKMPKLFVVAALVVIGFIYVLCAGVLAASPAADSCVKTYSASRIRQQASTSAPAAISSKRVGGSGSKAAPTARINSAALPPHRLVAGQRIVSPPENPAIPSALLSSMRFADSSRVTQAASDYNRAADNVKRAASVLSSAIPQHKAYGESEADFVARVNQARADVETQLEPYRAEQERRAEELSSAQAEQHPVIWVRYPSLLGL